MAGLTPEGFIPATYTEVRDAIIASLRAAFGVSIKLGDKSAFGQVVAVFAAALAELWEVSQAVSASQDPDTATGAALDGLCALTGTTREPARESEVVLTLTGTASTVVPTGSRASTLSTGIEFATVEDVTLVALTAWAPTTVYAVGDRRSNASRSYICTDPGTSAGSGGPTTTGSGIVDGTVEWRYLGEGTAAADGDAESVETGEQTGVAFDITVIETPFGGWSSVINLLDADPGNDIETDEDLRVRREIELSAPGTGTLGAIREALSNVDDVTSVKVFHNPTDLTDGDGMPPHSVEALVRGGVDQDIFDTLLANVAAGIATHGNTAGTAEDEEGFSHAVEFSRPDEIEIYADIEVEYDAAIYPVGAVGQAQIKAAVAAFGATFESGKNVVANQIRNAIMTNVPGVTDVPVCDIGIIANPTTDVTILIGSRELATFDTSRVDIDDETEAAP